MEAVLQAIIAAAASFAFVSSVALLLLLICRRGPSKPRGSPEDAQPAEAAVEGTAFDPSIDRVSMAELEAATRGFSPDAIIGDGSFGFVYKAQLSTGAVVAVKRLSADAFHGAREFRAEMETLGRIRHRNLARLLGYCAAGRDLVLIYEFLDGGSLDHWLHDDGRRILPWSNRLSISKGVAAGLAFLHEACRPRIIHRDIKPSNVLLDRDLAPKIADFGLARRVHSARSHVSTTAAGTAGYMPPEYREGSTAATAAADVYSFGVVMVEVVTARRPSWPVRGDDGCEAGLVRWARGMVEAGRGLEILDPQMPVVVSDLEVEQVNGFLRVAYMCTEDSPGQRPTMGEVVKLLDQI